MQELKEELTMATGEERTDELTQQEKDRSLHRVSTHLHRVQIRFPKLLIGHLTLI